MAEVMPVGQDYAALKRDEEAGLISRDWPSQQPKLPRSSRYFLCGSTLGCCPCWVLFLPVFGLITYALGLVLTVALLALVLFVAVVCGFPLCCVLQYFNQWSFAPWFWKVDLYIKGTYLGFQSLLVNRVTPTTGPKFMPVSKMEPKRKLQKYVIDYALNIKVPKAIDEEFPENNIKPGSFTVFVEESLAKLPMWDKFETFGPDEDPVAYVMKQLGNIYPVIYQDWADKRSDIALTRFCLYGLGAHRLETTTENGQRYFVVRTNALSAVPVREGFARYGGDAYFDMNWKPVKIVDDGLGPLLDDGNHDPVITRPGDPRWEEAKFRFRSSMSVLVTLVDHLYGIHMQTSNILVTAVREQLSANHPLRRFLVPFTYQTISVNDNARNNLVQPRSMGPRCFAFNDRGLQIAFAAAPKLLMSGMEVPASDGGPVLNRAKYVDYLKDKRGIDTEYLRQSKALWLVFRKFIEDYLCYYYATPVDVLQDAEIVGFVKQFVFQMEVVIPIDALLSNDTPTDPGAKMSASAVQEKYNNLLDLLANFLFLVTAGHEQVGAVEAYVQDASFCAFKWVPGKLVGTKQTATAQALLMSFTSTPMPKLLGEDWTHLFPDRSAKIGASGSEEAMPPGCYAAVGGNSKAKTPVQAFAEFQESLKRLSEKAEAYNNASASRPFPECFPLYVMNPALMETSISV